MNINKAILVGRVTRTPELKALPSGTKIVMLGLATNDKYKKDEEWVEESVFHNIVAFGKLAETIGQYVVKGQEIYVEGKIKYQTWEKKDGSKGHKTDIIISKMEFGQKPKDYVKADDEMSQLTEEVDPEDIPF